MVAARARLTIRPHKHARALQDDQKVAALRVRTLIGLIRDRGRISRAQSGHIMSVRIMNGHTMKGHTGTDLARMRVRIADRVVMTVTRRPAWIAHLHMKALNIRRALNAIMTSLVIGHRTLTRRAARTAIGTGNSRQSS